MPLNRLEVVAVISESSWSEFDSNVEHGGPAVEVAFLPEESPFDGLDNAHDVIIWEIFPDEVAKAEGPYKREEAIERALEVAEQEEIPLKSEIGSWSFDG